jgi:hypothetical protein
MKLEPLPTSVRLLTDFTAASVMLDSKPQTGMQSGQLSLDSVASGPHTLVIASGTVGASIKFDAREGSSPVVNSLEPFKDTSAILVTNLGTRARVYSSQKGTITVDGKPAGTLDPLGVELTGLTAGDHEIGIGEGADHRKVVYDPAKVPALTVYLNSTKDMTVGTLVVITGEDGVTVAIDGHPARVGTTRGQLRIPNLPPKSYTVTVSKDGFQPVPEQHVTVVKGEDVKAVFQMHPVPNVTTLRVTGGIPGTQVLVDGRPVGTVGADGSLSSVQVTAGNHTVQLQRDEYKPKTFQLNFAGGKDRTLTGPEVTLEATFGTLSLSLNPANAQVTYHRAGDAQTHPVTVNPMHLPEGTYTLTASAPHFVTASQNVDIAVGATKTVNFQLNAEAAPPPPKTPTRVTMSGWQAPWTPEGDHFTRKGGELDLFAPEGPGVYTFSAAMKKGKQFRWVAHAVDERNYVEFELDDNNFSRSDVIGGKRKNTVKKKHGLNMQDGVSATIQVAVSPAGIVQKIQGPDGKTVIDTWQRPDLVNGRFGILIRGKDEVNLSGFSYVSSEQ